MKLVNVLMSTYNGHKYIREQIDSILNQTYQDIKLYIRDDGSTDNTIQIIQEYVNNPKVIIIKGKNIGYGSSFMQLLSIANEGDFWAFSDQDDVWEKDKLERAVKKLNEMEKNAPNMYFHSFLQTDHALNMINVYEVAFDNYSFQKAITECVHLGFATVFNRKLRDKVLQGVDIDIVSHDWWVEMVVMAFGNVYYDRYIGAKHRRLKDSVSSNKLKKRLEWFGTALKGESEIHKLTRAFGHVYKDELNATDSKVLDLFVYDGYSFIKAIKKVCYLQRWRSSCVSELSLRFLMLLGKI